jgi:hypothetical protein
LLFSFSTLSYGYGWRPGAEIPTPPARRAPCESAGFFFDRSWLPVAAGRGFLERTFAKRCCRHDAAGAETRTGPVSFEAPMMCKFCETDISLGLAVCPSCGKLQSAPGQTDRHSLRLVLIVVVMFGIALAEHHLVFSP